MATVKDKKALSKAIYGPFSQAPFMEPGMADVFIIASLKALAEGTADAHQQKSALKWILNNACKTGMPAFGASDRETSFMLGRQYPGQQIAYLLAFDLLSITQHQGD
jgi:hypothetical protein